MSEQNFSGKELAIDWQTEPLPTEASSAHDLMRVPATGNLDVICLSKEVLGVRVHYHGGKSLPHLRVNCPACAAGSHHEWHGHFWAHVNHLNARYVVCVPAGPSEALKRELHNRGSLAGLPMRLYRKPQHLRGRVLVSFGSTIDPQFSMLSPPPLMNYLENMWGRHMKTCVSAAMDATSIRSEAEQFRSADPNAAAVGAPRQRRRSASADNRKSVASAQDVVELHHALQGALAHRGINGVNGST